MNEIRLHMNYHIIIACVGMVGGGGGEGYTHILLSRMDFNELFTISKHKRLLYQ